MLAQGCQGASRASCRTGESGSPGSRSGRGSPRQGRRGEADTSVWLCKDQPGGELSCWDERMASDPLGDLCAGLPERRSNADGDDLHLG